MKTTEEMDFGEALRRIKKGARMHRAEWRPDKYIHHAEVWGSLPYLEIVMRDGRRAPYAPSQCDMYYSDWMHWRESLQQRPAAEEKTP